MTYLDAVILGIVEGLTEFLPISSTAHLVVGSRLLEIPDSSFLSSFILAIQLGAIASVLVLYWRTLMFDRETLKYLFVAFVPTAIVGFVLYQLVKNVLLENLAIIGWALITGGIVLILFEKLVGVRQSSAMSNKSAFLIGCAQAVAIIPGVSRAGATILGGLLLGIPREKIVEFSFLLAMPTMLSATVYDLYKSGGTFVTSEWHILFVGFVVSFVAALASVKLLVRFIQTHSFVAFGIYRVVIGALILAFIGFPFTS